MNCSKPMIFNTKMVRAILEGRKTVTRRVVKFKAGQSPAWSGYIPDGAVLYGSNNIPAAKSPYRPGDILWVRETWSPVNVRPRRYIYKADVDRGIGEGVGLPLCWHPSIHMPREAARIFLRVTGVRVERLQEITPQQAMAEGQPRCNGSITICGGSASCLSCEGSIGNARQWFLEVWNNTIKPKARAACGWAANPWVWVISFERIEKPADWGTQGGKNG